MTQTKLSPSKVVARSIEFIFWQLLFFVVPVYVLSFLDGVLSALFDYDAVKSNTSIDVISYCIVFLFLVAIPRTLVAGINKPGQFKIINLVAIVLMGSCLCYDYYNSLSLGYATRAREFVVLSISMFISILFTIRLLKELPEHIIKKAD